MELSSQAKDFIEYPDIPIELCEGSYLDIFVKEKMTFCTFRLLIDYLGNFIIIEREEENCIDLSLTSDIRKDFISQDDSVKVEPELRDNTLTLVYGPLKSNVKYLHIRSNSIDILNSWYENICKLLKRNSFSNPSVFYMLQRELLGIAKCLGKLDRRWYYWLDFIVGWREIFVRQKPVKFLINVLLLWIY
ncbi:hypothetical protein HZS_2569 [Henneguya salminicola]|nr:hypothetical protein HZS_2569 [Henneguya salminicola]